jgi:hypothetical protein
MVIIGTVPLLVAYCLLMLLHQVTVWLVTERSFAADMTRVMAFFLIALSLTNLILMSEFLRWDTSHDHSSNRSLRLSIVSIDLSKVLCLSI